MQRNYKVLIGVIIAVLMLIFIAFSYIFSSTTNKKSKLATTITSTGKSELTESDAYRKLLDEYNNKKVEEANKTGDTYLSIASTRVEKIEKKINEPKKIPVKINNEPKIEKVTKVERPVVYKYSNDEVQQIQNDIEQLKLNWSDGKPHKAIDVAGDFAAEIEKRNKERQEQAKINNMENSSNEVAYLDDIKIVDGFKKVPAILDTDIDTDENSIVTVHIPSGEFKGAILYAKGYQLLTRTVDMTFDVMKFNGKTYKVTAKAIDLDTNRSSLSGNVNYRFFSRLLLPSIADGIATAGQIYAESGKTTTNNFWGNTTTTPEKPADRAVLGAFANGFANNVSNEAKNYAGSLPLRQVLIKKGKMVGIMFIGDVTEADNIKNNGSLK